MREKLNSFNQWMLVILAAFALLSLTAVAAGLASLDYWKFSMGLVGTSYLVWVGICLASTWAFDAVSGVSPSPPKEQSIGVLRRALARALDHHPSVKVMCILDGELIEVDIGVLNGAGHRFDTNATVSSLAAELANKIHEAIDQRELLSSVEGAARQQALRQEAARSLTTSKG